MEQQLDFSSESEY